MDGASMLLQTELAEIRARFLLRSLAPGLSLISWAFFHLIWALFARGVFLRNQSVRLTVETSPICGITSVREKVSDKISDVVRFWNITGSICSLGKNPVHAVKREFLSTM